MLELYTSGRLLARSDAGDTMTRHNDRDAAGLFFTAPPARPSELRHDLQVTAGVGLRF